MPLNRPVVPAAWRFWYDDRQEVPPMGKVILDAETRAKLNGLNLPLELLDEKGNLIGYCLSPELYRALVGPPIDAPAVDGPFTEEEIAEAMKQTDPGRPLADILRDLRQL
jgi:hypothetical protein